MIIPPPPSRGKGLGKVQLTMIDILHNYFEELTKPLESLKIKNVHENIWNVDEIAINLDHNPPKILAKPGITLFIRTAGRSSNTTLIASGSALGETIPPYIIFIGDRLSKENAVWAFQEHSTELLQVDGQIPQHFWIF